MSFDHILYNLSKKVSLLYGVENACYIREQTDTVLGAGQWYKETGRDLDPPACDNPHNKDTVPVFQPTEPWARSKL